MEMVGKIKEKKHMYNKPSEPKDFWKTRFHTESNKITQNPFKTFLVNHQEVFKDSIEKTRMKIMSVKVKLPNYLNLTP